MLKNGQTYFKNVAGYVKVILFMSSLYNAFTMLFLKTIWLIVRLTENGEKLYIFQAYVLRRKESWATRYFQY